MMQRIPEREAKNRKGLICPYGQFPTILSLFFTRITLMDDTLLIKVGITLLGLLVFGIFLTMYEFREHIIEKIKKRKKKS